MTRLDAAPGPLGRPPRIGPLRATGSATRAKGEFTPVGGPAPPGLPPGTVLGAEPGELQIWTLRGPVTEPPPAAIGELDDRERERANAFVRPQGRLTYLSAHIALRRILALHLGIAPAQVSLGRAPCPCCGAPHGRPVVTGTESSPHFSLSHSRGLVAIAVAAVPVGVDVQGVPSADVARLCVRKLHVREREELAGLSREELPIAFARLWTRKEAYLKGLGTGLGRGLAADYLGDAEGEEEPDRPDEWLVRNLPCESGHVAAVALLTAHGHRAVLRTVPADRLYRDDITALAVDTSHEDRVPLLVPRRRHTVTRAEEDARRKGREPSCRAPHPHR
ncbi:4'-phosphopantetheinyl transferase superfamily protein [Streptomyces sp. CNQ085]|uniref:4'-phosphopantetheinyl transferase family protein n=1 Tax=Streptomyces sp. CNQ085 TaxID=2886944 RepID=UPI001F515331|nr:4'-phosphopantetheinyl transferase superfamily protein [Streptomyces sp. CNQ085]MCI0386887.1 4'-phosphopantetheinyl transferase superfamily protein [Streptomyces sp. CNQ085]